MDKDIGPRRSARKPSGGTGDALVARLVRKKFNSSWYWGEVKRYDADSELYRVVYEDGDFEDLDFGELRPVLRPVGEVMPAVSVHQTHISRLPDDVLLRIFSLLHHHVGPEVLKCMQVCKRWRETVPPAVTKIRTSSTGRRVRLTLPSPLASFPKLTTLHLDHVVARGPSDIWVQFFKALGTNCPEISAIHFDHVHPGLRNRDLEALLESCRALKTLDICGSAHIRRITRPELLAGLHTLRVSHNGDLTKLPPLSIFPALHSLAIGTAYSLKRFPVLNPISTTLHSLEISGAYFLRFPEDLPALPHLASLFLNDLSITEIPSLAASRALTKLHIHNCRLLCQAPALPPAPSCLKWLSIVRCPLLLEAPSIEDHTELELLDLSSCPCLALVPGLTDRNLGLPNRHPKLRHLSLPNPIGLDMVMLDLPGLSQLEFLHVDLRISNRPRILACPKPNLSTLVVVVRDWKGMIPILPNLAVLELIGDAGGLAGPYRRSPLPSLQRSLPRLRTLKLSHFRDTCDSFLTRLRGLESLSLTNVVVDSLSDLASLSSLQSLKLDSCGRYGRIPAMCQGRRGTPFQALRELEVESCPPSPAFYNSLGALTTLETLVLRECGLIELPKLSGLRRLSSLRLEHCNHLSSMGSVRMLRRLDSLVLHFLPRLVEVRGFAGLTRLQVLSIKDCVSLKDFDKIQTWANSRRTSMCSVKLRRTSVPVSDDAETGTSASDGEDDRGEYDSEYDSEYDDSDGDSFWSEDSDSANDHESEEDGTYVGDDDVSTENSELLDSEYDDSDGDSFGSEDSDIANDHESEEDGTDVGDDDVSTENSELSDSSMNDD